MIDRETIDRTIINILDVHRYYEYNIFSSSDLYQKILSFGSEVVEGNEEAVACLKKALDEHRTTIDKIADDQEVTIKEFAYFTESLRAFRKKYIQKK